jgi:hypothetical protein
MPGKVEFSRCNAARDNLLHKYRVRHPIRGFLALAELLEHGHQYQTDDHPDGYILAQIIHGTLLDAGNL